MVRYIKKNLSMIIGFIMFILIVGISIFAPLISSHDPLAVQPAQRMQGPNTQHIMGTDFWGRDIFARVIYGGRTSLLIGFVSIGISLLIGGTLGIVAAYYSESKFVFLTEVLHF